MNSVMVCVIFSGIARVVCFGGAAYLAFYDKTGWGWLIVAGLLCSMTVTSTNDEEQQK